MGSVCVLGERIDLGVLLSFFIILKVGNESPWKGSKGKHPADSQAAVTNYPLSHPWVWTDEVGLWCKWDFKRRASVWYKGSPCQSTPLCALLLHSLANHSGLGTVNTPPPNTHTHSHAHIASIPSPPLIPKPPHIKHRLRLLRAAAIALPCARDVFLLIRSSERENQSDKRVPLALVS